MSDEPTGGYERDLREAENAMTAAGHPDIALGMRRHSEAQRNMMQGVLVPMFVQLVEKALGQMIAPLVEGQKETHSGIAALSGQFQALAETVDGLQISMRESQEDRQSLHDELAGVKSDVGALKVQLSSYIAGSKRDEVEVIKAQIAELRGPEMAPEQRQRYIAILMQMIAEWERTHPEGAG